MPDASAPEATPSTSQSFISDTEEGRSNDNTTSSHLISMRRRNSFSKIRVSTLSCLYNDKRPDNEIHSIVKTVEEHRSSITQGTFNLEEDHLSPSDSDDEHDEIIIPKELHVYKTLHFPSGDLFSGHIHAETGEMIYGRLTSAREMEVYEGPFSRGKRHGDGAMCVKMDGSGKFLGRYYEGQMHSGTLIVSRNLPSDFTYTGSFLNGDFHGWGKIATQNGSIYQGQFERGLFHGSGTLRMVHDPPSEADHERDCGSKSSHKEESVYTGDFYEGLFHGSGTMVYPNLSSYAGTWHHGQKLEGTETSANGDVFEGKFQNGIRDGMGVLKLKNGRVTKRGVWRGEILREDTEVCIAFADGHEYSGEHVASRPHGFGEMDYADCGYGAVTYTGQFMNGFRHGEGRAFFHNLDEKYEGEWVCDEPVDLKIFQHQGPLFQDSRKESELIQVFTMPLVDPDERPSKCLVSSNQDSGSTTESLTGSLLTFVSFDDTEDSTALATVRPKSPKAGPRQKERRRRRRSFKSVDFEGGLDMSLKSLSMLDFGDIAPKVYHYSNGDVFKGCLDANKLRQGSGVYTEHRMGSVYDGDWKDSMRHGVGHLILSSGVEYSGEFFKDSIHGQGVITLIDDSVYTGDFFNGSFHGHGTLEDESTKRIYVGEFANGLRHGDGEETFSDGSRYVGQYKNGNRHGTGVLYDSSGNELYRGDWYDDHRQGKGKLFSHKHEGSSWEGAYEGDFHCGKFCGMGMYTYTDGTSIEGQWVDDIPRDGDWTINYPDGSKFYGFATFYPEENYTTLSSLSSTIDFLRVPLPHGFGTLTYPSGQRFVGSFEYGEYQESRR
eukprot:CCRYP_017043-RA/>CCRYP_017043-RA protein AED:0.03 eAED:0.03 QI:200/1/1/1/0.5/0.33/3/303/830